MGVMQYYVQKPGDLATRSGKKFRIHTCGWPPTAVEQGICSEEMSGETTNSVQ